MQDKLFSKSLRLLIDFYNEFNVLHTILHLALKAIFSESNSKMEQPRGSLNGALLRNLQGLSFKVSFADVLNEETL